MELFTKIMNDWACIENLDQYKSLGMHWIAMHGNDNSVTYFGVEHN